MCTVTIIRLKPDKDGRRVRLACNRDESPRRPAALPPRLQTLGATRVLLPIDPQSGGTWIGINERGLIATLLNRNLPRGQDVAPDSRRARPAGLRSRGEIVPHLLAAASLADARQVANSLAPSQYPPFRAVAHDLERGFELRSDGRALEMLDFSLAEAPLLFTSSGLGDHLVDPPRRALFHAMFTTDADPFETQERYHRHFWPDRRHLSVCMSRDAARTVSHTAIELGERHAELHYRGAPPDATDFPIVSAAIPCRST